MVNVLPLSFVSAGMIILRAGDMTTPWIGEKFFLACSSALSFSLAALSSASRCIDDSQKPADSDAMAATAIKLLVFIDIYLAALSVIS